jgi:hypothetical protein
LVTKGIVTTDAPQHLRVMIDIEGTAELVQHMLIGGVHIGARALLDIFDMVWLYSSPIPVGNTEVFYFIAPTPPEGRKQGD